MAQHIIELRAENVKRLKAVHLKLGGETAVIGGRNEQGKTSLIDAIEMAFGGTDSVPDMPIRDGEEKARVVVKTEELVVERRFTKSGSYLKVVNAKGVELASPQKVLDKLVGSLSFDPLAFARMKPAEQAAEVKRLAGVNFDELDAERKRLFDERTDVNREVKRLEGALSKAASHPDAPDAEVSVADAVEEMQRLASQQTTKAAADMALASMRETAKRLAGEVVELESQLATKKQELEQLRASGKAQASVVAAMPGGDEARERELSEQVRDAESINAKVRANAERTKLEAELEFGHQAALELTGAIQAVDDRKREMLSESSLPVDGLAFDEEHGLLVDGVPFAQCSSARKLKVSVAIGLAANPELRVMLVRDGAYLDASNLEMLKEMASEAGVQLFVERVGVGEECAVIIEDGQVLGAEPQAEEPENKVRGRKVSTRAEKEEPGAAG